jgi:glycosyltransferase 2 family protein
LGFVIVNPPRLPAISIRQVLWMAATTLLFIPLALYGVSLGDVWHILQQSDWQPVALAVILFVLTLAAKAARWQVLFERPPAFASMFAALVIGQAGNFLLPARLGDVMRVYVLGRREGKPAALTIGTIAAEKLVELIVLIGLAALSAPFVPLPAWLREPSARLGVILVLGVALSGLLFLQQSRLRRLWAWVGARVLRAEPARMTEQFDLTLSGLNSLRQWPQVGRLAAWSALIWVLMIATNYVLFFALPIAPSWLVATVLLLVVQIGVAVPSTPGKVGVFQTLVVLTLSLFAVDRVLAFSYGLLLYVVIAAPQLITAGPFVWQEAVSLRRPQAAPRNRA